MPIHALLQRQLNRCDLSENDLPATLKQWQDFLQRVSQAYKEADQDRYTLERSQEISSTEMQNLYECLAESQRIAHLGSWFYDGNTNKSQWSVETFNIFGLDAASEPPSYEEVLKFFHEEDRAILDAAKTKAEQESVGYELELRISVHGQTRWIHVVCLPILDKTDNKVYRLSGTVMDITQRKASEEKVKALNQQLISTARQAGMAEIATSVLHNVGNVLNSVNVSVTLLNEHLVQSKLQSLQQLADLLRANLNNIEDFFLNSPQAKHLPDYLIKLAEYWQTEQDFALNELDLLSKNVTHIKEIIAMQQSVSGIAGIIDAVDINDILEAAYKINEAILQKYQVKIIKEYTANKSIMLDKVKIQQIVINLVRNAKDAVLESKKDNKQIILRSKISEANDKVIMQVIDNGIGIKPENITRIFSYGFTTKKNGHGFGLHTSALSAQEMGGTLTLQSDGENKGSTFTLELPIINKTM